MRGQIYEIFRQLYEEKIGGADLGDVFGIIGDVLTLVLADTSGLTKAGNVLSVEVTEDGGLQITASGMLAKLISTGGLQSSISGLSVKIKAGGGLATDADGIYATVTTGAAITVESEKEYALTEDVGTGDHYARDDHKHGTPIEPIQMGGYYFNSTGVNPNAELGYGTWTQVAKEMILVGAP
jgi:hypothetical protein